VVEELLTAVVDVVVVVPLGGTVELGAGRVVEVLVLDEPTVVVVLEDATVVDEVVGAVGTVLDAARPAVVEVSAAAVVGVVPPSGFDCALGSWRCSASGGSALSAWRGAIVGAVSEPEPGTFSAVTPGKPTKVRPRANR
jgi:hypothetical protein